MILAFKLFYRLVGDQLDNILDICHNIQVVASV